MKKRIVLAGMAAATVLAASGMTAFAAQGDYSTIVEIEDWGAAVTKAVVDMGQEVSGEVSTDAFNVKVTRSDDRLEEPVLESGARRVTNAYVSDADGNAAEAGQYVTIELAYGPSVTLSSALNYANGSNVWIDCDYTITQMEAIGDVSGVVATNLTGTKRLGVDDFTISSGTFDGIEFSYADYKPESDGEKHPLIIWLHGGGEGGTDATIPLSANKSIALASENVQQYFGGAYVLVPQALTKWMEGFDGLRDGTSIYAVGLMELIESYVEANPDVDADRIYVGGCSNGGYMTMVLMRDYPDYFAAAYPVCEGLADTLITEDDINIYKDQNIWFVAASTDTTLPPLTYTVPTYTRLMEAGAENVHFTLFSNVEDKTGLYRQENDTPHEYDGHWSWTYVYNDQVTANIDGTTVGLFEWMAAQSK